MIADDLANAVYNELDNWHREHMKGNPKLVIYMDIEIWRGMLSQLKGPVSAEVFEMYESGGTKFMNEYPIYRVLAPPEHGIQVFIKPS